MTTRYGETTRGDFPCCTYGKSSPRGSGELTMHCSSQQSEPWLTPQYILFENYNVWSILYHVTRWWLLKAVPCKKSGMSTHFRASSRRKTIQIWWHVHLITSPRLTKTTGNNRPWQNLWSTQSNMIRLLFYLQYIPRVVLGVWSRKLEQTQSHAAASDTVLTATCLAGDKTWKWNKADKQRRENRKRNQLQTNSHWAGYHYPWIHQGVNFFRRHSANSWSSLDQSVGQHRDLKFTHPSTVKINSLSVTLFFSFPEESVFSKHEYQMLRASSGSTNHNVALGDTASPRQHESGPLLFCSDCPYTSQHPLRNSRGSLWQSMEAYIISSQLEYSSANKHPQASPFFFYSHSWKPMLVQMFGCKAIFFFSEPQRVWLVGGSNPAGNHFIQEVDAENQWAATTPTTERRPK